MHTYYAPLIVFGVLFRENPTSAPLCIIYLLSISRQNMLLAHNRNFSGRITQEKNTRHYVTTSDTAPA